MSAPPPGARTVQVLAIGHSRGPDLADHAGDTHVHAFGPADRYPYAADRSYLKPCLSVDDGLSLTRPCAHLDGSHLRKVLVDNPAALYGW
ncbi:hypothetical protein SUDANB145_00579 [Streptomyces sp. enrichment culture]|uniref:hypothetical protein n=1 Tax=Streptomyces sp. enrichment culture TaxID=1795815 RepID=UPI003F56B510